MTKAVDLDVKNQTKHKQQPSWLFIGSLKITNSMKPAFSVWTSSVRQQKAIKINLSVTSHINFIVARCLINIVYLSAYTFIRS